MVIDYFRCEKQFFKDSKDEVAKRNLSSTSLAGVLISLCIIFFDIFTPYFFPNWSISLAYILFPIAMLLFSLVAFICKRQRRVNCFIAQMLTILFYLSVFTYVIVIDVFIEKTDYAMFFPILLIVTPVIFLWKAYFSLIINAVIEIIFFVLTTNIKDAKVIPYDCFNSLVGFFSSCGLILVLSTLRVRDGRAKYHYKQLSMIDGATGILNKATCEECIQKYLNVRSLGTKCALFIIDIDDFKKINDIYGHQLGDELISVMGSALTETFRSSDIVGRFGGDEFIVLMRDYRGKDIVEDKCKSIINKLANALGDTSVIKPTCSIGVALVNDNIVTFEEVVGKADNLMYNTKHNGKSGYLIDNL